MLENNVQDKQKSWDNHSSFLLAVQSENHPTMKQHSIFSNTNLNDRIFSFKNKLTKIHEQNHFLSARYKIILTTIYHQKYVVDFLNHKPIRECLTLHVPPT